MMALQKRIVAARAAGADRQRGRACWSTARRAEHELVLQGRLEGQAPDIDPVVYLTDCDPSRYGRGDFIRARIVGAQGYDLMATPVA